MPTGNRRCLGPSEPSRVPMSHKLIWFGDIHDHKPYEFICFGAIHGPQPLKCIWLGDIHGPKPYIFIWSSPVKRRGRRVGWVGQSIWPVGPKHRTSKQEKWAPGPVRARISCEFRATVWCRGAGAPNCAPTFARSSRGALRAVGSYEMDSSTIPRKLHLCRAPIPTPPA
jgi:hypothetical protein